MHGGQVRHPHRAFRPPRDHRVPDVLGALRAVHDRERPFLDSLTDHSGFPHEVQIRDGATDRDRVEPERRDGLLVQLDLEASLPSPEHADQGDAVHLGELGRQHVVEVASERLERVRAR